MRINVLNGWQGTGHKVYLPAGEHDVAKALGDYLVKNGHAVAIDEGEIDLIIDEPAIELEDTKDFKVINDEGKGFRRKGRK